MIAASPPPPAPTQPPAPSGPPVWPEPRLPRRRAPAFPRADLFGAVSVLSVVTLLGLPLAWLWTRLAPPQVSVVLDDRTLAALPSESQHRFDDLATFLLLGVAAGVLSAVAVWLLRQRRGPLALLGLVAGSLFAAWLAMRTGLSLADGRYAAAVRAASPDAVVSAAPRLESALVLIAQPLAAALTYGVAAATSGLDDLGRRLT
ncbi:MAG TPA: DUF2567 domain-containing protein [Pseudonocardiaceae bacterium]|jgi:hypothetical protein